MNIIKVAFDYWDEEFIPDGIKLWQISMHDHFLAREEIDRMVTYTEIADDNSKKYYYLENEAKFLNFFKDVLAVNKVVYVSSKKKFLRKRIAIKSTSDYLKKCRNALREFNVNDGVFLLERNILFVIHYDLSVLFFYPEKENILDLVDLAKKNGLFCLDYESLKQEN
ncbi:MAG: hypothetical protein WCR42_01925 [bacterium]